MRHHLNNLPDRDLAYLEEGAEHFNEYVEAVGWAKNYARLNRDLMMEAVLEAARSTAGLRPFTITDEVVDCHYNYVSHETHFGEQVFVTRKGAVRAGLGDLGIIPGSPVAWARGRTSCAASATRNSLHELQSWCGKEYVARAGTSALYGRRT